MPLEIPFEMMRKAFSVFPEHIKMQSVLILNEFKSDPPRAFHLFSAAQPSERALLLLRS